MIKKKLPLFLILTIIIGCKRSPLDITPDGRITLDDVFKSEINTEAFLNSVYSSVPLYFYHYQYFTFLAGVTDDAQDADIGNESSNIAAQWNVGGLTPSLNPLAAGDDPNVNHYVSFWTGIRSANIFLENINNAPITSSSKKSRLKAEATLLRAFFYWELIKEYGPMPILENPLDPSFDYATLIRPSFQDDVDFIVKSCDTVISNPDLPMRITLESERGRFTKAVAYAIKSEALLYNASPLWNPSNDLAKWQAAATASKDALSALTAGNEYELFPDYGDYFLSQSDINVDPKDKETIYEIKQGDDPNLITIATIPSRDGIKAGICPSQELVDAYDMQNTGEPAITGYSDADHLTPIVNTSSGYDPDHPYVGRDPRFYATIWYNGSAYDNINGVIHTIETYDGGTDQLLKAPPNRRNTHTGYYLRKYIDPRIQYLQASHARFKKYRLAEIYLNYAEAANEVNGPTQDVYDAIDTIRNRAHMPDLPSGLNTDEMRIRIRRERRVEMPYEEQRFWDVRRWKILDQTDKLVTGIEITKNINNTFNYMRFVSERRDAWQSKYLILPIPTHDVSIIPDFSSHQNPGW